MDHMLRIPQAVKIAVRQIIELVDVAREDKKGG